MSEGVKDAAKSAAFSPRTTVMGLLGFAAVLFPALLAHFDGDPETVANWTAVAGAGAVALGLLFARDNGVSSERAGAK